MRRGCRIMCGSRNRTCWSCWSPTACEFCSLVYRLILNRPNLNLGCCSPGQLELTIDRFAISGMQVAIHQISVGNDEFQSESGRKLNSILEKLSTQMTQTDAFISSNWLLNERMDWLNL